jgi:hypothetical protein
MKKVIIFILIFNLVFPQVIYSKENNTSDYLRMSYNIPRKYELRQKQGIPGDFLFSPGIILEVGAKKWEHCAMWWEIKKGPKDGSLKDDDPKDQSKDQPIEERRKFSMVIKIGYDHPHMWESAVVEIKDDLFLFTLKEKNMEVHLKEESYLKDIFKDHYVISAEYLHCFMPYKTMRKILSSDEFNIIVRNRSEKLVFQVIKEKEWDKLLEL